MKRSMHVIFIIVLLFTVASGCFCDSNKQAARQDTSKIRNTVQDTVQKTQSPKNETKDPTVTFIELGSVKCIPCRMMQPIMDEIEKEYAGQVKVVFHDVWTEEGQPYAREYRIRVIPTQIFLDSNHKEYFRHEGFFPKDDLVNILKQKGVQ